MTTTTKEIFETIADALPMTLGFVAMLAPFGALYYMLALGHAAAKVYGAP